SVSLSLLIFFFTDPATSEIYTLSLHDALPIWELREGRLPPPGRLPGLRSQVDRQDAASPARRQGDRRHVHGHPRRTGPVRDAERSEEHTSELQSRRDLVCRLLLEKKKKKTKKK